MEVERLPDPLVPQAIQRQLEQRGAQVTVFVDAPCKPAHGRFERREVWLLDDPELVAYLGTSGDVGKPWPYARQVAWIKRERLVKGKASLEITLAVTSLPPEKADARRVAKEFRTYWAAVENRSHGVRDTTLSEDASQVKKGAGPHVMAILRNLTLAILRAAGVENIAARLRTNAARCDQAVALVLNAGQPNTK